MQASEEIIALWKSTAGDSLETGIAMTFINVYGESTALDRYRETVDAGNRKDAARVVKSMQQLWEDAPDSPVIHTWPFWNTVCAIAEHIFDEDYPSRKRVPMAARDPNVNMYSEAVAPDDNIQEGGEPAPDVSLEDLNDVENSDTE